MASDKKIKDILQQRKLAPQKKFGQNFLLNRNIAEKIIKLAQVQQHDTIIEIGVGLGALTGYLATICRKVIGLEVDAGIMRYLRDEGNLPDNVTLIHQDILQADFGKLAEASGNRLKIIANLPYSISNPLLFKLIENKDIIEWAVLMLQKEVAQRLNANIGTKDYGILTVRLAACATVEKLFDLGPGNFYPRPRVDSTVVRISFFPVPARAAALPNYDTQLFKAIIDAAFQQRRKTLLNAFSSAGRLNFDKKTIENALDTLGLDSKVRGERLSVENFAALTKLLQQTLKI